MTDHFAASGQSPAKVAIVGAAHVHTGNFVRTLAALQTEGAAEVVAVYDHDAARAQKAADALGTTATTDLEVVLRSAARAAIVGAETNRHMSLVPALVEAGIGVFVEKPLAAATADAKALAATIDAAGVPFHTGHFYRQVPAIRAIKAALDSGALGDLRALTFHVSHDGLARDIFHGFEWLKTPEKAGVLAFGDLGLHAIDLANWLAGPLTVVSAEIDGPDHFGTGHLTGASGAQIKIVAGWVPADPPYILHAQGTKGAATVLDDQAFFERDGIRTAIEHTRKPTAGDGPATLVAALRGQPAELVTTAEAVSSITVMNALYAAAGRPISPFGATPQ
ncbi:Gfo/Idh/MocA family oxidoreductase [Acuticoccus sp. MNP-M23]|uniref:Gfo/Idh/MocA family protein n=1 Tax=Acuticoccus sp. MNP-M23 TaxID=3072793 RepID=UPI002815E045|nr:Gfo/Idh/MocA family oxidoreductase [Acuticoccus sp. MNP-M23]WMS42206.1 Gfo/Idh/MocA family oxidoreductase [Acuticoccus sp. MNP-M23]